jgi:hypothetical protein
MKVSVERANCAAVLRTHSMIAALCVQQFLRPVSGWVQGVELMLPIARLKSSYQWPCRLQCGEWGQRPARNHADGMRDLLTQVGTVRRPSK